MTISLVSDSEVKRRRPSEIVMGVRGCKRKVSQCTPWDMLSRTQWANFCTAPENCFVMIEVTTHLLTATPENTNCRVTVFVN